MMFAQKTAAADTLTTLALLYITVYNVCCKSIGDGYMDKVDENVTIYQGQTLQLDCGPEKGEYFQRDWMKEEEVLISGNYVITRDDRVEVVNGTSLQLRDISSLDEGIYKCQIIYGDLNLFTKTYLITVKQAEYLTKIASLESELVMLKNTVTSLEMNLLSMLSGQKSQLTSLDTKFKLMNGFKALKTSATKLVSVSNLSERNESQIMTSSFVLRHGRVQSELTFLIDNITEEIIKCRGNDNCYLESPLFYTDIPGYRMKLRVYPERELRFIGFFAGLEPGIFDEMVSWPFSSSYELSFKYVSEVNYGEPKTIVPTKTHACGDVFVKPLSSARVCGFHEFLSHDELKKKTEVALLFKFSMLLN